MNVARLQAAQRSGVGCSECRARTSFQIGLCLCSYSVQWYQKPSPSESGVPFSCPGLRCMTNALRRGAVAAIFEDALPLSNTKTLYEVRMPGRVVRSVEIRQESEQAGRSLHSLYIHGFRTFLLLSSKHFFFLSRMLEGPLPP